MERSKENIDLMKFLSRFNDVVYFLNDESKIWTTEDFYNSCKDESLIDVLDDFWFYLPELEENEKKYLSLVCENFDTTKDFDNGWHALIYYTWQGLIHYFEDNYMM